MEGKFFVIGMHRTDMMMFCHRANAFCSDFKHILLPDGQSDCFTHARILKFGPIDLHSDNGGVRGCCRIEHDMIHCIILIELFDISFIESVYLLGRHGFWDGTCIISQIDEMELIEMGTIAMPDWDALRGAEARGYERCRRAMLSVLETMRLDAEVRRLGQVAEVESDDS